MSLWQRLQLAFDSPLGMLLVAAGLIVSLLALLYLVLSRRQRKRDRQTYEHQQAFERAERLVADLNLEGSHRAEFFGRITRARDAEGRAKVVYILQPGLFSAPMRARLSELQEALLAARRAPFELRMQGDDSALVCDGFLDADGQWLPTLEECIADKLLSPAEKEEVLLQLARKLANLHSLRGRNEPCFYHGALVPRLVFVDRKRKQVNLGDPGLAFAVGADCFRRMLDDLRSGRHYLSSSDADAWLDQKDYLAPEIHNAKQYPKLGQAADFYSFGRLAKSLFGKEQPPSWCRFLTSCLAVEPDKRPPDFIQLEDWLSDPELALTHADDLSIEEGEQMLSIDSTELVAALDKLQAKQSECSSGDLEQLLLRGDRALAVGRLADARRIFTTAADLDPEHPDVLVGLAICAYEGGDLDNAEQYYRAAKDKDPLAARRFREHLTYKV